MDFSKGAYRLESSNDVLTEILLRLPSKSIVKFTCVSTRWNNFITHPLFRSERARRSSLWSSPPCRLLGFVQCNTKQGVCNPRPDGKEHSFLTVNSEEYFRNKIGGCVAPYFPIKQGYFLASSKDGLVLHGFIPHKYYVSNPLTGTSETLPPPPLPKSFPQRALSIGLTSNVEKDDSFRGRIINFRVVIATGCDEHHQLTGSKVIPIETYSSRTREWRRSKLTSEIPVAIENGLPPTVSGGLFHWFTTGGRYIVVYDSSSLDGEDSDDRRLVLKRNKKKKHVLQVSEIPYKKGSKIIWRSDNGLTMWFGTGNWEDGVEVYRKRDDGDDWTIISKVECMNVMRNDIIGRSKKDLGIEKFIVNHTFRRKGDKDFRLFRDMVWMVAFIPWNPKLIMVRLAEKIYVYDCINKIIDHEVVLRGVRICTDERWEWFPYFHSFSSPL